MTDDLDFDKLPTDSAGWRGLAEKLATVDDAAERHIHELSDLDLRPRSCQSLCSDQPTEARKLRLADPLTLLREEVFRSNLGVALLVSQNVDASLRRYRRPFEEGSSNR